jgi:hypothetical protein
MKFALPAAFLLVNTRAFVIPNSLPSRGSSLQVFDRLFSTNTNSQYPVIADESVMSKKAHGTSEKPVQKDLRWKCDYDTADRSKLMSSHHISSYFVVFCNLNRVNSLFLVSHSLQLQSTLCRIRWLLDNNYLS